MKLDVTKFKNKRIKYNTYNIIAWRTFLWVRNNTDASDWIMCWWPLGHSHKLPAKSQCSPTA